MQHQHEQRVSKSALASYEMQHTSIKALTGKYRLTCVNYAGLKVFMALQAQAVFVKTVEMFRRQR